MLLFSPVGRLLQVLGRKGEGGPGDVAWVGAVFAHGDTILAHDHHLRRISVWHSSGTVLGTIPIPPPFNDHLVELVSIPSQSRFLMVTRESPPRGARELFTAMASMLLFERQSSEWTVLERRPVGYHYRFVQNGASTTYPMPFLGAARPGAWGDIYFFLPLDSAIVELADLQGHKGGVIRLPIQARGFDRDVVNTYRDSLLGLPGLPGVRAGLSGEDRIRTVFNAVETPELAPRIGRVEVDEAGGELWVEESSTSRHQYGTWYVVDLAARVVKRRIRIPKGMRLLHVRGSRAVILHRGPYDEELLGLYQLTKKE